MQTLLTVVCYTVEHPHQTSVGAEYRAQTTEHLCRTLPVPKSKGYIQTAINFRRHIRTHCTYIHLYIHTNCHQLQETHTYTPYVHTSVHTYKLPSTSGDTYVHTVHTYICTYIQTAVNFSRHIRTCTYNTDWRYMRRTEACTHVCMYSM